jgi:hypothetical protein
LCVLLLVVTPIIGFTGDGNNVNEAELLKLRIKELELKKEILELESKQTNKATVTTPQQMYQTPTTNNSSSNGYTRGPRGGCYTISKSGNKRYVDRSLCN